MWKVLDRDPRAQRLRDLLDQFRAQERSMTGVLHELQCELEYWNREASLHRTDSGEPTPRVRRLCSDLQDEVDLLATEIVHVRMAIAGTNDELAAHEGRRPVVSMRSAARRLA